MRSGKEGAPPGVPRLLYLHGFASSPEGRKVEALRRRLGPEGVEISAPDLNVPEFARLDYDAMIARARAEADAAPPTVVAGSSLGALVALSVASALPEVPLVLVAPALGFGRRWIDELPPGDPLLFFHHGENGERPIHRAFFERMAAVDVDRRPPAAPVTVVMGTDDESVPFGGVEEVWRRWTAGGGLAPESRFVAIAGGDHGLTTHVPEIAREIRRALLLAPGRPPGFPG